MIPNLPTDNLYKFLALSGVFLFCFGMYFINAKTDELNERVYKEKMFIAELKIKIEWLEEEVSRVEKLQKDLIEEQNGKFVFEKSKLHLTISEKEFKERFIKVKENYLKQRIDTAKMDLSIQYTEKLLAKVEMYRKLLFIWLFVSALLSCYGFLFWYKRVQKPMDQAALLTIESQDT